MVRAGSATQEQTQLFCWARTSLPPLQGRTDVPASLSSASGQHPNWSLLLESAHPSLCWSLPFVIPVLFTGVKALTSALGDGQGACPSLTQWWNPLQWFPDYISSWQQSPKEKGEALCRQKGSRVMGSVIPANMQENPTLSTQGRDRLYPLSLLPFAQAPSLHNLQHTGILSQTFPHLRLTPTPDSLHFLPFPLENGCNPSCIPHQWDLWVQFHFILMVNTSTNAAVMST